MTMTIPKFDPVDHWEQLPSGIRHRDVSGVAVDSSDRVYLFTRGEARLLVYEPDGRFIRAWPDGMFTERTHGITIGPDDSIYCVDEGDHTVRQYAPGSGAAATAPAPTLTLGNPSRPSDTGYDGRSLGSITRAGPPFNRQTNLAVAPNGDLYVTDGYGNARVHHFDARGALIRSWGEPGTGPGQFNLPHGVAVLPDGRVMIADRENDRVQIFSAAGDFLAQWTDVQRPTQVLVAPDGLIYVSELWWQKGQRSQVHGEMTEDRYGRVSIYNQSGAVVARLGGGRPGTRGNFCAPHDIALDSRGDLYIAEVTYTFALSRGQNIPADTPTIQKFRRVA